MKLRKMKLFLCCLLVIAAVCAAGCAKAPQEGGAGEAGPGVPGGNFAERDTLSEAFAAEGNATVSLSGDETLDLTGITFTGRKEIFLNNASLRLIGVLTVSEEGVIDIKPGEGCREGVVDMRELRFDLSRLPDTLPHEVAIVEIRPGAEILPPETGGGIQVIEFEDILTVVSYFPEEPGQEGAGG
ncbi:MAG: hypothetical protein ACOX17_01095 [Christensenellales bacterium]|jgi:hypothetical protein